jgi:hypothetical protein
MARPGASSVHFSSLNYHHFPFLSLFLLIHSTSSPSVLIIIISYSLPFSSLYSTSSPYVLIIIISYSSPFSSLYSTSSPYVLIIIISYSSPFSSLYSTSSPSIFSVSFTPGALPVLSSSLLSPLVSCFLTGRRLFIPHNQTLVLFSKI